MLRVACTHNKIFTQPNTLPSPDGAEVPGKGETRGPRGIRFRAACRSCPACGHHTPASEAPGVDGAQLTILSCVKSPHRRSAREISRALNKTFWFRQVCCHSSPEDVAGMAGSSQLWWHTCGPKACWVSFQFTRTRHPRLGSPTPPRQKPDPRP